MAIHRTATRVNNVLQRRQLRNDRMQAVKALLKCASVKINITLSISFRTKGEHRDSAVVQGCPQMIEVRRIADLNAIGELIQFAESKLARCCQHKGDSLALQLQLSGQRSADVAAAHNGQNHVPANAEDTLRSPAHCSEWPC